MKIVDLHNHTTFSYDGSNTPEEIIENAIVHGVSVVGITDHQFSVLDRLSEYKERIMRCKDRYQDQITVLCGLEIGTRPKPQDLLAASAADLDYCIFESLDSRFGMDLYEFFEWRRLFKCRTGLAHTDIFALSKRYGINVLRELKNRDIFWELNTSGHYDYYYDFLTNAEKRLMVKQSGIELSVGSDTHWVYEYRAARVRQANRYASELGNRIVFGT